jgi:hypothetical protein
MTKRDADQPLEFDDLEPLPEDAELAELPDDLEPEAKPAPEIVAKPIPAPVARPAPAPVAKPAPTPTPEPKPDPPSAPAAKAAPTAAAPAPGAVRAASGSRRERMEKDREARGTNTKKAPTWVRFEGPGEKPTREMEAAPGLLHKAALWLLIGCVLPWGGWTADWMGNVAEKLLILAGLYTWHQAHLLRDGLKVPGFITSLGKKNFIPLFVAAAALLLLGFVPLLSFESLSADFKANSGPMAEKGFMILAGLTLTHIYDYSHGGRFNPMFPIMFLAPALAGVMALLKVVGRGDIGIGEILGAAGAILVTVAGSMAAYTMYVALKEAKRHGEAKKAAQVEARKAARVSRRES